MKNLLYLHFVLFCSFCFAQNSTSGFSSFSDSLNSRAMIKEGKWYSEGDSVLSVLPLDSLDASKSKLQRIFSFEWLKRRLPSDSLDRWEWDDRRQSSLIDTSLAVSASEIVPEANLNLNEVDLSKPQENELLNKEILTDVDFSPIDKAPSDIDPIGMGKKDRANGLLGKSTDLSTQLPSSPYLSSSSFSHIQSPTMTSVDVADLEGDLPDVQGVSSAAIPAQTDLKESITPDYGPAFSKSEDYSDIERFVRGKPTEKLMDTLNNSLIEGRVINREDAERGIADALDSLNGLVDKGLMPFERIKGARPDVETLDFSDKHKLLPEPVFFDFLLGFDFQTMELQSLSPSMGYAFSDRVSVGLGLILTNLSTSPKRFDPVVGFRGFVRYYVLSDKLYLYTESNYFPGGDQVLEFEGRESFVSEYTQYLGLGYKFSLNNKWGLNAQMLYSIEPLSPSDFNNDSKIKFRVGLSFN